MAEKEKKLEYDKALSEKIAEQIEAKAKECYGYAWRAQSLLPSGTLYVEGLAVPPFAEHGWCQLDDKIIDPTAVALGYEFAAYFPIATYTMEERQKTIMKKLEETGDNELPLIWGLYGWGGEDHPNYHKARRAAIEFMMEMKNE